jgi:hypothetical protein
MQRRMCRTAVDRQRRSLSLTHPRAGRTRRSRRAMPVSRDAFAEDWPGLPEGTRCLAAGSDICGLRSREALHRSVSTARNSRARIPLLSGLQH